MPQTLLPRMFSCNVIERGTKEKFVLTGLRTNIHANNHRVHKNPHVYKAKKNRCIRSPVAKQSPQGAGTFPPTEREGRRFAAPLILNQQLFSGMASLGRHRLDTGRQPREFSCDRIPVHHASLYATHHLRLGGAKSDQRLFPVSRRNGVFQFSQRSTDAADPAAIDLGAPLNLANAFLCRLMMSHLSTQLRVPCTLFNMSTLIFHSVPPRQPPMRPTRTK